MLPDGIFKNFVKYRVIVTPNPVNESAIRGKFLREHINDKAGCCGAKELLKLYSYRYAYLNLSNLQFI